MRFLELKLPPAAIALIIAAAMWLAAQTSPAMSFNLPARHIIAAVLGAAGLIMATWGVAAFRRVQTTINPMEPASASSLVTAGIYRLTRNPMYLGVLLVLLGWAAYLSHGLAFIIAVALIPIMNRLQIIPEERILTAKFGSAFTDYKSKVRRWL